MNRMEYRIDRMRATYLPIILAIPPILSIL